MTVATATARDAIRAAAADYDWTTEASNNWFDRFVRPATLPADSVLVRFYEVADFAPLDLVGVRYDDAGRVTEAFHAGPGAQSVVTGQHVGPTDVPARGKRAAVLALLQTGPLPDSHRLSASSLFAAQDRSNAARAALGLD